MSRIPPPAHRESGREDGSVTVVTAAVIGIVVVATMGVADVGKALIARSHAQAAADAAALAAVQEQAFTSGTDPTQVAEEFARRNGATLVSCACDAGGTDAVVVVTVPVGPLLLVPGARQATAAARAVVDLPTVGPSGPLHSRSGARGSRSVGGR